VAFDSASWINRAKEILSKSGSDYRAASEATQFATSMLTAFYGPESPQLKQFLDGYTTVSKNTNTNIPVALRLYSYRAINNVIEELEHGLVENLRVQVTGEVLAELAYLGKEILSGETESAKNVAAVLVAAAFEDLIRRMGLELGGVKGRPPMHDVITALKDAAILKGAEIGITQSFMKFRNDSLHADRANVSRIQVESCSAFIDALLMKHFS
jgi:hypothetical protein